MWHILVKNYSLAPLKEKYLKSCQIVFQYSFFVYFIDFLLTLAQYLINYFIINIYFGLRKCPLNK